MSQRFTWFFLWLIPVCCPAQDTAELRQLSASPGRTPAETAVTIGKSLLGRPYRPHTLEAASTEQLVVNLQTFDCQTFVETALALALAQHNPGAARNPTQLDQQFRRYLTRIRYRNGLIDGYGSRLHYLSDWLRDNEQKGVLRDVTRAVGGVQVSKAITYMTQSPQKYPLLSDKLIFQQVAMVEKSLSQQAFWFIPRKNVRAIEKQLREGDLVMLTAARPGLDARHVGLVVYQNGRPHLLHASSDQAKVVITNCPLADYVATHKRLSGIRVARINEQ
jgi:hypothetical protein